MRARGEACEAAIVYASEFLEWYNAFASPVDDAADDAHRALVHGSRDELEFALAVCRQQLYAAKMIDSVHAVYEEQFQMLLQLVDADEFSDHATWWGDWDLDPEDGVFGQNKAQWLVTVKEQYTATRQSETDSEEFMKKIVDCDFRGDFKHIKYASEWFRMGTMAEGMEKLIRRVEQAL